jgi:hypothetical protein
MLLPLSFAVVVCFIDSFVVKGLTNVQQPCLFRPRNDPPTYPPFRAIRYSRIRLPTLQKADQVRNCDWVLSSSYLMTALAWSPHWRILQETPSCRISHHGMWRSTIEVLAVGVI